MIIDRLGLILDWYQGMISERTGRLVYTYEPREEFIIDDGSAIRNIASVWDVALLSRFLGRPGPLPMVERSLAHYVDLLVARDGALVLDSGRLGEPSGIAHSAFLILALLESGLPAHEAEARALSEGILRQQRPDGSYRIYFEDHEDDGLAFYPGEAMLALMWVHAREQAAGALASVERGLAYYRDRFPPAVVAADLMVFYANWQSQYGALLHEHTQSEVLRTAVRDYVFALHDRVLRAGFYGKIRRKPMRQVTVEVACALEGVNDAYAIAVRESDADRTRAYAAAVQVALAWLLRAQRLESCTSRERGGFGHSLADRTQRIDVAGHVVGGLIKTVRNGIVAA